VTAVAIAVSVFQGNGVGAIVSGDVIEIRYAIGTGASQDSPKLVPDGAIVTDGELDITTPYSPGTTIVLSVAGIVIMKAADSNPTAALIDPPSGNLYGVHQDTAISGGPASAHVAVSGAPGVGAGFAIVRYVQP